VRLEVKQSAVLQSWAPAPGTAARPAFDIRERTGHYDGAQWIDCQGRQANLYVFCLYARRDEAADHRDPSQWAFYVVPTTALPKVKRIGIASVRRLAPETSFGELAARVATVALGCGREGG
jgi:hypothetical protein